MPIKSLLLRYQPVQLYIVLVFSICYFAIQLILSHLTHALTLLMASYHMLCNIIALSGCILTIKHSKRIDCNARRSENMTFDGKSVIWGSRSNVNIEETAKDRKQENREMKLRNTFGWTRIGVLSMLIVCIILASLSFSLLVEALQTLVHIDHQDTMHLPLVVIIFGCIGLILNGLAYLLIGGYTMHQGSFLHLTPTGEVVMDENMWSCTAEDGLKRTCQVVDTKNNSGMENEKRQCSSYPCRRNFKSFINGRGQGAFEILRDISSTVFVLLCSIIVYIIADNEPVAKFVDPILSIFSCILLVGLSYRYMKESCLILLQTIPASIDLKMFESTLTMKFPQIVSYHDLHIWQLSANKFVATIHIKFQSPKTYIQVIQEIRRYFFEQGITHVTIQPEFNETKSISSSECLVRCNAVDCADKVCCKESTNNLCAHHNNAHNDMHNIENAALSSNISSIQQMKQRSQSVNDLSKIRSVFQNIGESLIPMKTARSECQLIYYKSNT